MTGGPRWKGLGGLRTSSPCCKAPFHATLSGSLQRLQELDGEIEDEADYGHDSEDDYEYVFETYVPDAAPDGTSPHSRDSPQSGGTSPLRPPSAGNFLSPNKRSFALSSVNISYDDMKAVMLCKSIHEETEERVSDFNRRVKGGTVEMVSFSSLDEALQ